jgi:transglutaminase-like putative cysteine protease
MRLAERKRFNLLTLLLYGLSFFLFLEWMRPLEDITNTGSVELLTIYTGMLFLLTILQLSWFFSTFIKLVGMLYIIHFIFFQGSFFDGAWLQVVMNDIIANVSLLSAGNLERLSDLFRTILFLVLLWLVSYLMHYWLMQARRIFLFFFITVIYVTVLDTFTVYDASGAIIRIVVIGLLLLSLLRIVRVQEKEGFGAVVKVPVVWVLPIAFLISFASFLGIAAPKADPQWPDPVPFIKSASNANQNIGMDGPGVSRIGYGTNDSRLGGPFLSDETVVFTADVEEKHYWRVETKAVYTGKGWEQAAVNYQPFKGSSETLYEQNVQTEIVTANIEMTGVEAFSFLVYPGQLTAVRTEAENVAFEEERISGKISTYQNGAPVVLGQYVETYDYPKFSIQELRESPNRYPADKNIYLQLPGTLPDRVNELAYEITNEESNAYDKAKAIERYFVNNGYVYETKDVAVPGPNDDYVDQFLFETLKGYCDNFSSSMVVLLRSVGIPTRWVKGFTYGEYKDFTEEDKTQYEVKNANAHSWVEAYFPGVGWVPFEPTRGFTNSANFLSSYEQNTAASEEQKEEQTFEEKEEQIEEEVENEQSKKLGSSYWHWSWVVISFLLIIGAIVVWKYYKSWIRKYTLARYKGKGNRIDAEAAYERLLWLFQIHGIKRKPEQTLREFSVQIDHMFETNDMKRLTRNYEKVLYENSVDSIKKDEFMELWENLIKKIQS